MSDSDNVVTGIFQDAPTNWAIIDGRGRTHVVIEAPSAAIARRRATLLRDEIRRLPSEFSVTLHTGPTRTAWYADGWFRLREELERLDGLPRCSQCGNLLNLTDD